MTEEKIHRNALKPGYQLHWYRIERVLGQGGFGITYLAQDFNLDRCVAVKEYLPVQIAVREGTDLIQPVTADTGEQFRWGLDRFLAEAQTLARFEHPNIVRVRNVFEANNTAYMVMAYEEGESLHEVFNRRVTLAESELRAILLPLLDGLEKIHAGGFIHRDIKPANIVIRKDGSPVLLDFGSARQSLGEQTHMLTRIFTPGYAPLEQYYTKGDQQGPWTDIYALAATLYRGLAGEAPTDAMQRSQGIIQSGRDPLVPARQMGRERYSDRFLRAIDRALSFKPKQRPQTVAAWRPELSPPRASSRTLPGTPGDDQTTLVDRTRDAISHALASWRSRLRIGRLAGWWGAQAARRRSRPPPSHIPTVWLAGLIASATILLVSLIVFVKPDGSAAPPSAKPPASVLRPADTLKIEVVAPEAKAPPPERPSENQQAVDDARRDQEQSERRKQEQIAALLGGAREDIKVGRLTLHKGNNALEKYRSVLALQADHPQAAEGIRGLVEKLVQRAREAMDGANWSKAQAHLDQAAAILPDAEAVAGVRTELNARKAQAPKPSQPEDRKVEISQAERNVNKLIEQARRGIERKHWEKAQAYIDQATAIMPQAEDVVLIQGELIAHRAQAERQPVPTADRVEPAPPPSPGKVPVGPNRIVKIEKASSTVSKVRPGETIEFVTEYSLTLPEGEKNTYVEVTWVLKKDGKKLGGEGVHAGMATSGTNAASNELTLPGYAKPGRYVVEHIVKAGNISDTGKSYFSVVSN